MVVPPSPTSAGNVSTELPDSVTDSDGMTNRPGPADHRMLSHIQHCRPEIKSPTTVTTKYGTKLSVTANFTVTMVTT